MQEEHNIAAHNSATIWQVGLTASYIPVKRSDEHLLQHVGDARPKET